MKQAQAFSHADGRPSLIAMVMVVLCCLVTGLAQGQCPNNNTLLPGGTITPNCPGTTTIPCITGGQYALINVTAGRNYTFSTCGAPFDTQITLYNNTGGGSLGFNDDSGICGGFSLQSYLAWTATFTGQLRVLVDQYNCANNTICASLVITCATPPVAMTNDECGNAIPILVIDGCFMQTYTNTGATRSITGINPTCGGPFNNTSFRDVWFSFTAPANGIVIIESVPGTMQDGVMQLVQGSCASFTNVECDDDDGVGFMPMIDRRCAPLTPGAPYMIRFWGLGGATGSFGLCVRSISGFTTPQEDCAGGFTVCGNQQLSNTTNYSGCTADLNAANRGCLLGNERQGTWYYFSPSASGTIGLNIAPTGNVDYDFAVWGPMTAITCPPTAPPLRCSWAYPPNVPGYPGSMAYRTGMRTTSFDPSEGAGPIPAVDGYTSAINVIAGQQYIMYIDNFDINGQAFTLDWSLTGGASLDCTVLPVEMADLRATAIDKEILVEWTTVSEYQSGWFIVERSFDAEVFIPIARMEAAGVSHERIDYKVVDRAPGIGMNYYRIKQMDTDGTHKYSDVVGVMMYRSDPKLVAIPNPAYNEVNIFVPGSLEGMYTAEVIDATGRPVLVHRTTQASNGLITIPVLTITSGVYHLRLSDHAGNTVGTVRFVKR